MRVRRTIDKSLHPVGNDWSHVLDAEPISLNANSDSFSFVLWKKGVYNLAVNSVENWRSAEPKWPKLAKIPRAMETIATTCDDEIYEIWSKGGGVIRYDVKTGKKLTKKYYHWMDFSIKSTSVVNIICYYSIIQILLYMKMAMFCLMRNYQVQSIMLNGVNQNKVGI